MNQYQLWKLSVIITFVFLTFGVIALEQLVSIHDTEEFTEESSRRLNEAGREASNTFKEIVGLIIIAIVMIGFFNPGKFLYKRARYATIEAFGNVVIAPFGNVKFKTYILAEVMTECIIPLEDVGKVLTHVITGDWNKNFVSQAQKSDTVAFNTPEPLRWWLYACSFITYFFRFNQNMRKWLVYGHKIQGWNALKYVTMMAGPISYIIYNETGIKPFKYGYFIFKSIGQTYKLVWDFYFDWGLFRGTRRDNWMLRDNMKFTPTFYYCCMVVDVIGLYFWIIIIVIYD
jgi:hypothetical protein